MHGFHIRPWGEGREVSGGRGVSGGMGVRGVLLTPLISYILMGMYRYCSNGYGFCLPFSISHL